MQCRCCPMIILIGVVTQSVAKTLTGLPFDRGGRTATADRSSFKDRSGRIGTAQETIDVRIGTSYHAATLRALLPLFVPSKCR